MELRSASVRVGTRRVLRDVSCTFPQGVSALVGHNGAGKSTLMKTLAGVLRPAHGDVLVDGRDPLRSQGDARTFLSGLGWMPQYPRLPGGVRVQDTVRYAAWLRGVAPQADLEAAHRALDAVGLDQMARRRVKTLSGGQQRRVALACALAGEPRVLLLDEPTVGLDPDQRQRFLAAVRASAADRTVVISTHLMEDVLSVAERVVVMVDGQIVLASELARLLESHRADTPQAALTALTTLMSARPPANRPRAT